MGKSTDSSCSGPGGSARGVSDCRWHSMPAGPGPRSQVDSEAPAARDPSQSQVAREETSDSAMMTGGGCDFKLEGPPHPGKRRMSLSLRRATRRRSVTVDGSIRWSNQRWRRAGPSLPTQPGPQAACQCLGNESASRQSRRRPAKPGRDSDRIRLGSPESLESQCPSPGSSYLTSQLGPAWL